MLFVKAVNGRVEEYENGSIRRSYGSNIIVAATDGAIVAAVTKKGQVEEYISGSIRRIYASHAVGVQVSGGTVAVSTSNGRIEEYVNGSIRRSYLYHEPNKALQPTAFGAAEFKC